MGRPDRPGIAKANRRREGDFSGFVERIAEDAEALDGLIYAYESLDAGDRTRLARAVIQDLDAPAAALSVLLAVEEDQAIRHELAAWIIQHGTTAPWVSLRGTCAAGEACLICPEPGGGAEALRIAWDRSQIKSLAIETLDDLSAHRAMRVPTEDAADVLAPLLWRHLRAGGVVPDGARRYADFFRASPRP